LKKFRLDGVIGIDILASDVAKKIDGESALDITVKSGGGDILEGFAIFNMLDEFEGNIDMHIDYAASMMSVIVMAGDKVTMKDSSSILMIHRPWGGKQGNSEDLRSHADTLDKMEVMLTDLYSNKTGMSKDKISALLSDETYMDAREALDLGFIDEVKSGSRDMAMAAMAGMQSVDSVDFDAAKLVAKIESMKGSKSPVRDLFNGCETLAKVESVMRQELKLSQSEATAIVAAVKKLDHGDRDQKNVAETLKSLKFTSF